MRTSTLDRRLDGVFQSFGERVSRRGLLRRAAVVAGAVAGYSTVTEAASGSHCGANWGACGGKLCCGQYDGCSDETGYYCGSRVDGCTLTTAKWSRCCSGERYDWWDCCWASNSGGPCPNPPGSPAGDVGCASCAGTCGAAYCSYYRCSFRIIVSNAC